MGATLTFHNISNWDTNPNMLFMHLLDTARNAGIASFTDASGVPVPSSQIRDNFAGSLLGSNPLVAPGTGNILLTQQSFTTTPRDFVYTFTADQLNILSAFILNQGNLALGLDPDCHFWNNGITLTLTTCPPTATPARATRRCWEADWRDCTTEDDSRNAKLLRLPRIRSEKIAFKTLKAAAASGDARAFLISTDE